MNDKDQAKRDPTKLPICPISLSGQMNGIFYWYAEDCPTQNPFLVQSEEELQTGCRDDNLDCSRIFLTREPKGEDHDPVHCSDNDPAHCFLKDSKLRQTGLSRRLPPNENLWLGREAKLLEQHDYDLEHDGIRKRIRVFFISYHPPHNIDDAGMNRVVKIGIGQELDEAPGNGGSVLAIEEHCQGDCYYKLRSGEGASAKYFHVLVVK